MPNPPFKPSVRDPIKPNESRSDDPKIMNPPRYPEFGGLSSASKLKKNNEIKVEEGRDSSGGKNVS